ncbi:hypothetical protein KSD_75960 [Ktedonobacter sp. SOSP1-85]|uniref:outer membrane protein assembly factor BamB family protein n=1 Tax=Ktedonobacter sp. SOSP1-85 TaxID=2778367 RepID=UPI001915FBA8|nr:PQQ-binding-like beta-propeller repeat protein [Ktedonobacter sp. SOSP1-85]GHO79825.1 hypothetical protein KSD_75960 [Ktedonobacter sp. SOSP1-85]
MLKVGAPLLVVCLILGGFIVLIIQRHANTSGVNKATLHANGSPTPSTDSVSFARIQTISRVDSTLYEADGLHYLYAVNMRTGATTRYYFDQVASPFVIDHDILYTTSEKKGGGASVLAWRLNNGRPTLLWHHQQNCCSRGSFTVANGAVYIFSGGGIGAITALRASDGTQLWNYPTNGLFEASLTVANGILYAGTSGSPGGVFAFNASTGKLLWKSQGIGQVLSAPVVANGVLYRGATDRTIAAFNATTGALLWSYPTDYAIIWQPVVRNGVVYVGTGANSVFALRANNGSLLWHQRIDKLFTPASISANRFFGVFVGSASDDNVFVGSESGYMCALRASDGTLLWQRQFSGLVVSPFDTAEKLVYVSSQAFNEGQNAVYALQASNGVLAWRSPENAPLPISSSAQSTPGKGNGMIPLTRTGIPAFTLDDVKQYFKAHPLLTTAGKPGTIVKLAFMMSKEASSLMNGESIGIPDDALVCYVELQGPFDRLPISTPGNTGKLSFQRVHYVIDAQTGNQLVFGAG